MNGKICYRKALIKGFLIALLGCVGLPHAIWATVSERDFFPLYFGREIHDGTRLEYTEDWLWPFGYYQQKNEEWYWAVRPFVSWGGHEDGSRFLRVVPPLGLFDWADNEQSFRFQPFFIYRKKIAKDGSRRLSHTFFPFYSRLTDGERTRSRYYSFLYGWFEKRYGVDEGQYWLFPLYLRTRRDEFVNHSLLVPFFGYGSGDGGINLRAWPLVGYKNIPNRESNMFVLWPLYGRSTRHRQNGEIEKTFGCFPFYSKTESPTRESWGILWPLFQGGKVRRERRFYDYRAILYPFFQHKQEVRYDYQGKLTSGQETKLFFPFFGNIHKYGKQEDFQAKYWSPFAWKIAREKREGMISEQRILFPFYWSEKNIWVTEDKEPLRNLKLWPLFSYQQQTGGGMRFRLFDPFWFRFESDKERHYSPFFTLFESQRDSAGYGYDQFFGKSIYKMRHRDYLRINFLHLWQGFDTPQEGEGWSVLHGLVGRSQLGQNTRWRLFWIPF